MYRFYIDKNAVQGEEIHLTEEDNNHIRNVLRMRTGEEITVCDGDGMDYHCCLMEVSPTRVAARILKASKADTELSVRLVLFQGMPKKDKMELIIQKAVELGVSEIVPVMTKRTVVRLEDARKEARKLERWQSIARAAAMQSMRGRIPEIRQVMSLGQALKMSGELEHTLIPYEHASGIAHTKEIIAGLGGARSVGIFIGPEGGFEDAEISQAISMGALPVTLGHRILRTETAGMTMLSLLMFAFESDDSEAIG